MSHQKTKRIESPLKGMVHSMIIQNNPPTIFSSRISTYLLIAAQKRKPIFDDTAHRSSVSRSNSMRKKIFSKTQKSNLKPQIIRFSKLQQAQQFSKRSGEEDIYDQQIISSRLNSSSQSSSIQQEDSGLKDVKRQLFPQTPKKKQNDQLQKGRQWLTKSNRERNRKLFEGSMSPPKSHLSISTKSIDKTAMNFIYQTPQKTKQPPIEEKFNQRTQFNSQVRGSSHIRTLYPEPLTKNISLEKEPEKDIAKQIRDLHYKMLQKTKACSNIDEQNRSLKQQNLRLREQNRILKGQQLRLSIRPQETVQVESSMQSKQKKELVKITNESIFVKVKMQRARSMLKNLLQISQTEVSPQNSIINLEQTLKQVLKQLQI